MVEIRVSTLIDASPPRVWDDLRRIESHVEWMSDAVAIRFVGDRREGTGTEFECDTRVGPFRLTDRMEITDWVDGSVMGVRHVGFVTGEGRFVLEADGDDRTRFSWEETLRFPRRLGGRFGARLAAPILRFVWRRNLRALAARFSG